jgi:2-hydroxychromene-2-carboxylate isomerase
LFAGLLKHHGQLGPAEIAPKRDWTYRHVLWLAQHDGVALQLPATHPFNPLGLLRLALACDVDGTPNRYVCERIFRHVWCSGADAADAQRLQVLTQQLAPARDPAGAEVKAQLKAHTEEAIAAGVFGVPSFALDGKLFWGYDALPMLRAWMQGDAWFDGPGWSAVDDVTSSLTR